MEDPFKQFEARLFEIEGVRPVLEAMARGDISTKDAYILVERILRDGGHQNLLDDANTLVPIADDTPPPTLMQTVGGMPMLNPIMQAAIAETVFLDGDAPELRNGPPPPGFTPAVPVQTESSDPVIVGLMLERASEEVRSEFEDADARIAEKQPHELVRQERTVGVPGYEPGRVPALRTIAEPTGTEVAGLPPERRQELARKALTTSQGRRSLIPALSTSLERRLRSRGIYAAASSDTEYRHRMDWTVDGVGVGEMQESFSPVEVAASAFARRIAEHCESITYTIEARSAVGSRRFGWTIHYTPGA